MPVEQWKPVYREGFKRAYLVSDQGNVKSLIRKDRFGRWKGTGKNKKIVRDVHGYSHVFLWRNGRVWWPSIHKLVGIAFLGYPGEIGCRKGTWQINHKDGVKTNNCVENLEWVTGAQNNRHAVEMGLTAYGERSGNAKLCDKEAMQIFRLVQRGVSRRVVAKRFGVSATTASYIFSGRHWKHIRRKALEAAG